MPSFSEASARRLAQCDPRLPRLFNEAVKHFDCTVITGHRGKAEQEEMVRTGRSKVHWPDGKHNTVPSLAADVAPYPIDWEDRERFTLFAGFVKGLAVSMGIKIRWGGDWDGDTEVLDNGFDDLPHFELMDAA